MQANGLGELAQRLGVCHPGFAMSAIELIDRTLQLSGLSDVESFPDGGRLDCWPAFATGHFLDGFVNGLFGRDVPDFGVFTGKNGAY